MDRRRDVSERNPSPWIRRSARARKWNESSRDPDRKTRESAGSWNPPSANPDEGWVEEPDHQNRISTRMFVIEEYSAEIF